MYYFLYTIDYSIAISKTIILGFMQPLSRLYIICDLSSFVFDNNSTKYFVVSHNILYISHSINARSVLEITACFQLLSKPPYIYLLGICCNFAKP